MPWYLWVYLFVTIFGDGIVLGKPLFYNLIIPSIFFYLIGTFINYFAENASAVPLRQGIIAVIVLFILDQGIKLVVIHYQNAVFSIIDDWLVFKVYLNKGHFINRRGIIIPSWLYSIIPVLPVFLFRYGTFYKKNAYLLSIAVILLSSSILCLYTDKIFYGGAYDYIYLKQFMICDLKDIYLAAFYFVLFQSIFFKQSLAQIKKTLCTDPFDFQYWKHEYHAIKQWLSYRKQRKRI
jgi:lipoprotein signal peptidase